MYRLEATAIDSLQEQFVNSIFKGKEGKTNALILNRLLNEPHPLNKNKIRWRIDKSYGTVYPRIDALKELGLLEAKDPAGNLWGLSALGLWVQAHRQPLALQRCGEMISKAWKTFTELYSLDNVKTEFPYYEFLTDWLKSDVGLLDFLNVFGPAPISSEQRALLTFRRMIDLSILNFNSGYELPTFTSKIELAGATVDPTEALAEIVRSHKLLSQLHEAIREVDGPLYAYINNESIEKVRSLLPHSVADKLAATPFFKDQLAKEAGETLLYISETSLDKTLEEVEANMKRKLRKGVWRILIHKIVIDRDRVSIVTEKPESISTKWREYCDLYFLRRDGKAVIVEMQRAQRVEK